MVVAPVYIVVGLFPTALPASEKKNIFELTHRTVPGEVKDKNVKILQILIKQ